MEGKCKVGKKFEIQNAIAKGSFGQIYNGENVITHQKVAIKFEPFIVSEQNNLNQNIQYEIEKKLNKNISLNYRFYLEQMKPNQKKNRSHQVLIYECRTLRFLNSALGFPSIYWYGFHEESNSYALVMDLLDVSISELFKKSSTFKIQSKFNFDLHHNSPKGNHFSLKTVLMIADQMISRLEFLHKKGFIHCDIKPENMLLGRGYNSNVIYLIDFGLSKRFIDENRNHIDYGENSVICGTARYMSINCHIGINLSRRDDMESLGYVLIYLLKGSLPWQGLTQKKMAIKPKVESVKKKLVKSAAINNQEAFPKSKKKYLASAQNDNSINSNKKSVNNSNVVTEETLDIKLSELNHHVDNNDLSEKTDLYMKIAEMKLKTPLNVLCEGIPEEFQTYMQQVRSLRFEDEPDYAFYRQLFRSLFNKAGFVYDMKFDWNS